MPTGEAHPPGRVVYVSADGPRPKGASRYGPVGAPLERIVFEYDSRGNWVSGSYFAAAAPGAPCEARRAESRAITYF